MADEACRVSFEAFAAAAFRVVEPGTEFEYNWHIGCFTYEQPVLTEHGYMPIGDIVEQKYSGRVLSYNHETNATEWKKITHRFKNNGRPLYDLICSTGEKICLTDNHPVFVNGKYQEAEKIKNGDRLMRLVQEFVSIVFVSPMSQPSKGEPGGNIETGECFVRSITKSLRVSDTVYNIEVDGNNNYFTNGILVHNCISEHLHALHRGEIRRLIVNLPPRSLKSFLVARAYPAWVMGQKASEKFISTSYGHQVSEQNSLACRRIMKSEWYKRIFPDTIIDPSLDRGMHFETTQRGQYYAATALSPIVGLGCGTLIIDDPVKPMEAMSDTIRNSTNANIRGTLFSRFDDKRTGKLVLVMQRLHEDDPTGNLLKDGGYTHLKLPAEARQPVLIMLGKQSWAMKQGELLSPSRLSREILDKDMIDMSEYHYASQMLQEPVPLGGGEFKEGWLQYYTNEGLKIKEMNLYILVDPAGGDEIMKKKNKLSDRTAMIVIGLAPDNNFYWLDGIIDRLNPTERVDALFKLHRKWNKLCGRAPKVGYEKYALMTDTHYIKKKQEDDSYRFPMVELGGNMAKNERIRRMIPDLQRGRWWYPESMTKTDHAGRSIDLVAELVKSEMPNFPRARYDDCLDSMSRIYDDDLEITWPRLKLDLRESMIYDAYEDGKKESWVDF